nr:DEAD/DEAH box helicase [Paracoccus sp. Z118]
MTQFSDLKLDPKVLKAVTEAGYPTPTPIQAGAIPPALEGRDVLGIAQTGTGKTASFTLPMITLLGRGRARARMPRSLVLCPTRELAAQVAENFDVYAKYTRLTKALLIGGVSMRDQEQLIDRGVDVLIATPGRLLDHFERGNLLLQGVQIMVVDEADRMLDMGFIPDIERIFQLTPFTRQTLFFSATMAPEIERITNTFLTAPVRIEVARQATASETITQKLIELTPTRKDQTAKQKRELLRAVIDAEGKNLKNAIIFCNRKTEVDIVAKSLKAHGYDAAPLHGDLDQRQRTATLDGFRDGTLRFLIASDVAARGLDIPAVSHVINFDLPSHAEDYVHRIGRTGRAGRQGTAISIATPADEKYLAAIESLVKQTLPRAEPPEGFSLSDAAQRAPREPREGGRSGARVAGSRTRSRPRRDEGDESRRPARAESARSEPAAALPEAVETVSEGGRVDLPEARTAGARSDERRREPRADDRQNGSNGRSNGSRDERNGDRRNDRSDSRSDRGDGRRDGRQARHRDRDRGPALVGMGDHVPDFMLTSFRNFETAAAQPEKATEKPAKAQAEAVVEQAPEPAPTQVEAVTPIVTQAPESPPSGPAETPAAEKPAPKRRSRARKPAAPAEAEDSPEAPAQAATEDAPAEKAPPRKRAPRRKKAAEPEAAAATGGESASAHPAPAAETDTAAQPSSAPPVSSEAERQTDPLPEDNPGAGTLPEDALPEDAPAEGGAAADALPEDRPADESLPEQAVPKDAALLEDIRAADALSEIAPAEGAEGEQAAGEETRPDEQPQG